MSKNTTEINTIFDYLASLTASERVELGKELGYSPGYFNLMASTQAGMSFYLALEIYESRFNKKVAERGGKVTKAMMDEYLSSARCAWRSKRGVRKKAKA